MRLIAGLEQPSKGEIWLHSLRVPAPRDGPAVAAGDERRLPGLPDLDPYRFMGALGPRWLKVTGQIQPDAGPS